MLEKVKPDITFLQYKVMVQAIMKTGSYTRGEYYGNSTTYAYKAVSVRRLYEYLREKGWA